MSVTIDHIVLGADTLEQGVRYIADKFGAEVPKGGEHLQMGTHNCVMSLGGNCYFEIIAIAPHLEAPNRPRWFDLDNPVQQAKIKQRPRLLTWVVKTADIGQSLAQVSYDLGEIIAMQRGDLAWQLTIRQDGSLPFEGVCPALIEWRDDAPPYAALTDLDCKLNRILIESDDLSSLSDVLKDIGVKDLVQVEKAGINQNRLNVEFSTPLGRVMLD